MTNLTDPTAPSNTYILLRQDAAGRLYLTDNNDRLWHGLETLDAGAGLGLIIAAADGVTPPAPGLTYEFHDGYTDDAGNLEWPGESIAVYELDTLELMPRRFGAAARRLFGLA